MQRRKYVVAAVVTAALATTTVAVLQYGTDRGADRKRSNSALTGPTKAVSFAGYQTRVPASWPVYDLSADPTRCVRFDQHAVYLGTPGADQDCPAHAVGRTEALLIQPLSSGAGGTQDSGADSGLLSTDLHGTGVSVTASYEDSAESRELASSFVQQPTATPGAAGNAGATTGSTGGPAEGATGGGSTTPVATPDRSTGASAPIPGATDGSEPTGGDPAASATPTGGVESSPAPGTQEQTPTSSAPDPSGGPTAPTATPGSADAEPTASADPGASPTTSATTSTQPTDPADPADPTDSPGPTGSADPTTSATNAEPTPPSGTTAAPLPTRTYTAHDPLAAPAKIPSALLRKGPGFDTCAAPSLSTMAAWKSTTLDTVGVYIGGVNRACPDGNLSAAWVKTVHGYGYTFTPTYVGLQAPCTTFSRKINPGQAFAQGVAAADDAVAAMRRFGFGMRNPVFLDMEYFVPPAGDRTCANAVLDYQTGWTTRLHRLSYVAGVYTGTPALQHLVAVVPTPGVRSAYALPDVLWLARWTNTADVDFTPHAPNTLWVNRRLKQYTGGHAETHGGVKLNIDSNYVDGAVARPGNF